MKTHAIPGAGWMGAILPSLIGLGGEAHAARPLAISPVTSWLADEDGYLTEDEALAQFFPTATDIQRKIALPEGLSKADLRGRDVPRHYFRYAAYQDGKLLGFAVIDNVQGKARPITYVLATDAPDANGLVRALGIEILVYRESHGFEVGRAAFRKQFQGKSSSDAIALKDDIRNVAGATISCRSVTDGVHDLLALIHATPIQEVLVSAPAVEDGANITSEKKNHPHSATSHLTRTRILMNAPLSISIGFPPGKTDRDPGAREQLLAVSEQAFSLVADLERQLSLFVEDSAIARLNAQPNTTALEVSDDVYEVLSRTQMWSLESGGALAPTAGALIRLWKGALRSPSVAAIEAARKLVGTDSLELAPRTLESPPLARLIKRGTSIDLGGSAKGFALERVQAFLQENGIQDACLDFGGQLLVLGIAHTVTLRDLPMEVPLVLDAGSLATTGDQERGLLIDGVPHSHIIDPRTGRPALGEHTVTVFANSALDADALSTLLFVLDFEDAKTFAKSRGIAARFTRMDASTTTHQQRVFTTDAWNQHFGVSK